MYISILVVYLCTSFVVVSKRVVMSQANKIRYKIRDFKRLVFRSPCKVYKPTNSSITTHSSRHRPGSIFVACFSAASVASYYKTEWFSIPVSLGFLFICFIQFQKTRKREAKRLEKLAANHNEVEVDDYLAYLYQCLPLRSTSKIFGYISEKELPKSALTPILNFYCWYFDVNLEEAKHDQIEAYKSVSQFFQRELKSSARAINTLKPAVVPCDGRVLHYGKCENGIVEQVKGVRYSIERFLGYTPKLAHPEQNDLFYCVLYLAPGDYHLFHSPCSWVVDKVIHFPGTLMSVNPIVCKIVRGVFTLNERVLLSGTWQHGFFSYTAVGATGVGSIKINFLKDKIKTNKGFLSFEKDTEIDIEPREHLERGAMVGGFNFGSTIVLMFEAPKDFKFSFTAGQKIRMGDPLGDITPPSQDNILSTLDQFCDTTELISQKISDQTEQFIQLSDDLTMDNVEQLSRESQLIIGDKQKPSR